MSSLNPHRSPIRGVAPGLDYLAKYVDKASGHWFWREGRRNHAHDAQGQAVLRWKVRPTHKTLFASSGSYSVARLFLEHAYGRLPDSEKIKNLCGLPQCVNPDHWSLPSHSSVAYLLAPWGTNNWIVVDRATRQEPARAVAVRLRLPDALVHVVVTVPSFDRDPAILLSTVCGKPVTGSGLLVVESPITCTEGC